MYNKPPTWILRFYLLPDLSLFIFLRKRESYMELGIEMILNVITIIIIIILKNIFFANPPSGMTSWNLVRYWIHTVNWMFEKKASITGSEAITISYSSSNASITLLTTTTNLPLKYDLLSLKFETSGKTWCFPIYKLINIVHTHKAVPCSLALAKTHEKKIQVRSSAVLIKLSMFIWC